MLSSGLSYLVPDWRGFTMSISILAALCLFTIPFFPESPRFLYARNRYKDGRKLLKQFGEKTNTELSEKYLDEFEQILKAGENEEDEIKTKKFTLLDLFKSKNMAMISINLALAFTKWNQNFC